MTRCGSEKGKMSPCGGYKATSQSSGKMTLPQIVSEFKLWPQHEKDEHCHITYKGRVLGKDVMEAASCENYKSVLSSHQRRIGKNLLQVAGKKLINCIGQINAASDFDALHSVVNNNIISINGIGELAVYDISVRLGKMRGYSPMKVYLHAGTRVGAQKLLGKKLGRTCERNEFPPLLSRLPADHIESILCIYKDNF